MTSSNSTIKKRKKGGGRKFTDGRFLKRRFVNLLHREFEYHYSVQRFLWKANISRQAYYRFLSKNPIIKKEIQGRRESLIFREKQNKADLLLFLRKNPEKSMFDYHFRNFEIPEINTPIVNMVL